MRRIPRYLSLLARWLVRRFLRKSLDPKAYAAALESTLAQLPTEYAHWAKEGEARTAAMNRQLAWSMAFVAGAVNAGGFLAVHHYTSHMTGVVSAMADLTVGRDWDALRYAAGMLAFFLGGAFVATFLISYGKRHRWRGRYALALVLEAALLILFGYTGSRLEAKEYLYTDAAVALLCFIMGLHNAVTTNISGAAVRTTHLTGTITDLGIELSRLLYRNQRPLDGAPKIMADRGKLRLLALILVSFFIGGVAGALGFERFGFRMTVPLALFLLALALRPLALEMRIFLRHLRRDLQKFD